MDTPPKRIRKRVRVRVSAEESDRRAKYRKWFRLGLKILIWSAIIAVVAVLQYQILKRFGNPPPLE